ncbi:MAG: DUF4870 domain-containing protein [Cytophagaceae bacterium]|jgi:uncharacterized membrane protein|nr:DUF4870 domain-containing protein [Cytophagaceae bacterium]
MNYHELPQPEDLSKKEKEDAMGAYMMMFAAVAVGLPLPIINLIAAVIYYFVNRNVSRFVHFHALQALISSIPLTLMNGVGLFWGIRILFSEDWHVSQVFYGYLGTLIILNISYYIMGILAAVKAYKGRMFYYWFFGQLSYHYVFQVRETDTMEKKSSVNRPPQL